MAHLTDDAAALLNATRRDPAAFAVFYRRHEDAILVFMLRRTRSPELAADLTAEVFATALAGASRFRATGAPPAAWLFGIARNLLAASFRRARVQDDVRRKLRMPPLALTDELIEAIDDLSDAAAGREAMELLEHLPAEQREAIRAHVLDERDYREIAAELDCSSSVVRKRVSRGLAVLRQHLEPGDADA
jgi:RNA polymerase sigma factor (sigma-70 family)